MSFSSSSVKGLGSSSCTLLTIAEDKRACCLTPPLPILTRFLSSITSLLSDRSETTDGAPPRVSVGTCDTPAVALPGVNFSLLFSSFLSLVSCPFLPPPGPPC